MADVYLARDGHTDLYGIFSTREKAQAWIDQQKAKGYPWDLVIEEFSLDEAEDLR